MAATRVIPNIAAVDPLASAGFYQRVLGLNVKTVDGPMVTFASSQHPAARLSVVEVDNSYKILGMFRGDAKSRKHDYTVEVDDVDECYQRAEERGCVVHCPLTTEPSGHRRFLVQDPHGMIVNVVQARQE